MNPDNKKQRIAWYLYDFGNSAYATVVLLAVFSAYFQRQVVGGAEGSRLWGIALGIAMLIVAVTTPVLGVIADFSGKKKQFLAGYTALACVATALLFFAQAGDVLYAVVVFIVAEIGYRGAQVFYNALLPDIAAPHELGRVSGTGWAIGSMGGIVCLLIVLPLIQFIGGTTIVRSTLVITAVFFALATLPTFFLIQEKATPKPLPKGETYWSMAMKQLRHTIQTVRDYREFLKFMVAFLIYNDGVITLLNFAAIIGAVLFGMTQEQLIIFVIAVQITNVLGAYAFGLLADRLGCRSALLLALALMTGIVLAVYSLQTVTGFYIAGLGAGFAMAGLQSVSRTFVGVLAPAGRSGEFYSFFAVAGRTSSFIGPAIYGYIAAEAAWWYERAGETAVLAEQLGQRIAILSIGGFLVVGFLLLLAVRAIRPAAQSVSPSRGVL